MSAKKNPNTDRHGGPGTSHKNADKPAPSKKGQADNEMPGRSKVSGGGGEADSRHSRDPDKKGGTRKANNSPDKE
jgi:hypothetical protein